MKVKDLKPNELTKLKEEIKMLEAQGVKSLQVLFDITHKLRVMINKPNEPNKCLYCKENITDSIDPNVLCSQCRENFGHTFYNEL